MVEIILQNAPDCLREHVIYKIFPGEDARGPPRLLLSPPVLYTSPSTLFEMENPAFNNSGNYHL